MKYYLLNSIHRIKQYSYLLDAKSAFLNKRLIVFNENKDKQSFIFRANKELLISQKGIISKANWELLDLGTILIDIGKFSYLFHIYFQDDQFTILQLGGNDDFLIMYDDKTIQQDAIKSTQDIDLILSKKYLNGDQNNPKEKISNKLITSQYLHSQLLSFLQL